MSKLDPVAMRVIDENLEVAQGTFIYHLHERLTFDRASLKSLVEAVERIAAQRTRGLELDSVTATKLFHLYDYVVRCALLAHFDPQDGCRIKKLLRGRARDWHDDLDELHGAVWSV